MVYEIGCIFGAACATYLWNTSEPTRWVRARLGLNVESRRPAIAFLARLSECATCSGFWAGVCIGTHTGLKFADLILYSAVVAVVSELVYRRLTKF